MNLYFIVFNTILLIQTLNALNIQDIVFLIINQEHPYNLKLATNIEDSIQIQSDKTPIIFLSARDFSYKGDWTLFPVIPSILSKVGRQFKWLFICNEHTHINLQNLLKTLNNYECNKEIWFGHALHDREPTIIHHFAFPDNPGNFSYPNIASGFVISYPLVEKIVKFYDTSEEVDFSIDISHELAMFIWDHGFGKVLIDDPHFCVIGKSSCATYVEPFKPCGKPLPIDAIYFAVKTCSLYHDDRVPVVKKTWADFTRHIEFFSDELDSNIPTVKVGVPNTERGHCAKTMEIIRHVGKILAHNEGIQWAVITDDDTIISPGKLRQFLSCYSGTENTPIAIGERYGYKVRDLPDMGYNFITGGGGIVLNRQAIFELNDEGSNCKCPRLDAPDDMNLSICLYQIGAHIVHSPYFHQARPMDYAEDYLKPNDAISFHKHWRNNPVQVYNEWFYATDKSLFELPQKNEL